MKRHLTQSRTGVLAIILLGMMAIFVMRLFYLQIIKHSEYVSLAQASQQRAGQAIYDGWRYGCSCGTQPNSLYGYR